MTGAEVWFLLVMAVFGTAPVGMTQVGPIATKAECEVAGRNIREAIGAKAWSQTICIKGVVAK